MRKHIKLIVFCISLFIVFITYMSFASQNRKKNYIALGDSVAAGRNPYGVEEYGYTDYIKDYLEQNELLAFYTKEFAHSGFTTDDVIDEIEDNDTIEVDNRTIYLKEALRESNLVTISIGANNFLHTVSLDNLEEKLKDMVGTKKQADSIIGDIKVLLELIKKYAKEQIIVVGYYNPLPRFTSHKAEIDELVKYFDYKLQLLCEDLDIDYVDIFDIFDGEKDLIPNPFDIHPSKKGYQLIAEKIIKIIE